MIGRAVRTTMSELEEILENEWYIVRHSGEIPEIAYNASIYHLTRAKDGPHATLTGEQRAALLAAAVERFYEIIVRDLDHANHNTPIYRGVERSIANFTRFLTFCARQQLDPEPVRARVVISLEIFLKNEQNRLAQGNPSLIDCTTVFKGFAKKLGVCLERFGNIVDPSKDGH